jgi:hypothetical protein
VTSNIWQTAGHRSPVIGHHWQKIFIAGGVRQFVTSLQKIMERKVALPAIKLNAGKMSTTIPPQGLVG